MLYERPKGFIVVPKLFPLSQRLINSKMDSRDRPMGDFEFDENGDPLENASAALQPLPPNGQTKVAPADAFKHMQQFKRNGKAPYWKQLNVVMVAPDESRDKAFLGWERMCKEIGAV